MIRENTVLILGAGASMPYDYPSGVKLRQRICQNLNANPSNITQDVQELLNTGLSISEIKDFRDALFFSGKQSVDEFLEHRIEFFEIGKRAIAQALICHESTENLFNRYQLKLDYDPDWYRFLFSKMSTSFDEFDANKISFITFNYDRSLEHYLFTALKNSYGKNDDEVREKILKIRIIHLHGQLGYLPWQEQNGRDYSALITPEILNNAAEGIKIIHEDIADNKEFNQAKVILNQCSKIFFLGFGFHPTNLKRLKIEKRNELILVAGTAKGITVNETRQIEDRTNSLIQWENLANTDIIDFFRSHYALI